MNSSVESIDRDARETGRRETFDAIDVDRRGSRVSRVRLLARRRQTNACINPIASIHSTRVRACIRARDGRGRRCIHTVIPYILPRNTRVFDSYHHRPCMFSKTCMRDRFVPRIETQYVRTHAAVVWFGRHTRHDTHTHIVLYFTLYVYTVREVLHTLNTKEHVLDTPSINHAWHAFVDATSRARLETSERRRRGRTNERTRSSSSPIPTKRDATASHSRANHRCRENPLAERDGKVNARGIHSLIHSVTRGTEP